MLKMRFFMNSSCEDVLAFKTCCSLRVFDQNLEIHVENLGDEPVFIESRMLLETRLGMKKIDNLMPGAAQKIAPGEIKAFYCYMDENVWEIALKAIFYDTHGNAYEHMLESG